MIKAELVDYIQTLGYGSKVEAEKALNTTFRAIADKLAEGEEISIPKFGIFKTKLVAEREGRNPQTGESLTVPAHYRVGFKASKGLKDILPKAE